MIGLPFNTCSAILTPNNLVSIKESSTPLTLMYFLMLYIRHFATWKPPSKETNLQNSSGC